MNTIDKEFCILLVEDNPGDVLLISTHLKSLGNCRFDLKYDGESAITHLKNLDSEEGIPSLIILDLNLPRQNGMQVLEFIKSREALKMIPVVIFTSSNSFQDVVKAYALNANSYIVKPYDVDEYYDAIAQIWSYWGRKNYTASKELILKKAMEEAEK